VSTATGAGAPVLGAIDEAIGHTPLVRLRLPGVPPGVELWGKCEWFNPGGSVKDRTALSIVREGEKSGALRPGRTIIDSSSGNTTVDLPGWSGGTGPDDTSSVASYLIARNSGDGAPTAFVGTSFSGNSSYTHTQANCL